MPNPPPMCQRLSGAPCPIRIRAPKNLQVDRACTGRNRSQKQHRSWHRGSEEFALSNGYASIFLRNLNPGTDRLPFSIEDLLFRLSHEALAAELPDTAAVFAAVGGDEPATLSRRVLRSCVDDHLSDLGTIPAFDFAKTFISRYLARAYGETSVAAIRFRLYTDVFFENERNASAGLERMQGL